MQFIQSLGRIPSRIACCGFKYTVVEQEFVLFNTNGNGFKHGGVGKLFVFNNLVLWYWLDDVGNIFRFLEYIDL